MAKNHKMYYKIGQKLQIDWFDHVEIDHREPHDLVCPTVVISTMGVYVGSDKMHRNIAHHYNGEGSSMNDVLKVLKRAIKKVQPAFNLDDLRNLCLTYDAVSKKLYGFYLFTFILDSCKIRYREKSMLKEWKNTISSIVEK